MPILLILIVAAATIAAMHGQVEATRTATAGTIGVISLALMGITGVLWRIGNQTIVPSSVSQNVHSPAEERFQSLARNSSDVIAIIDPTSTSPAFQYVSPSSLTIWGREASSLFGADLFALVHPDDRMRLQGVLDEALQNHGENILLELRLEYPNGYWCISDVIVTNLSSEPGIEGILLTCRDISERKAFEEQLSHQAFHDSLTGLPNRTLLVERLGHALYRAKRRDTPTGVIFLDLDNFKVVNDSLGHDAGDILLTTIAKRLEGSVGPGDTVARFGGDEFMVLLEELHSNDAAVGLAERIAEVLKPPIVIGGRDVFTSASIGIAVSRGDDRSPDDLIQDADTAMYQAKVGGKAHYVAFDSSMNTRAVERLELETDMRRAFENNEFRVYYQPIVTLETGKIGEVEALVRWEHPIHGLLPPSKFIPVAEETGMIVDLGMFVLREACRQVVEWHAQFPDHLITAGVNVSPQQLCLPHLVEEVAQVLKDSGLPGKSLKLEITESAMMLDQNATIEKMHALKALGIRLAIDDFGTGYSSMAYLSNLPVDTLKIDQSFVKKMGKHEEDNAIVAAIVTLAQTLNLHITSEGIETSDQLARLQALSCDHGQGYFFARPLPAEEMTALLAEGGYSEDTREQTRYDDEMAWLQVAA